MRPDVQAATFNEYHEIIRCFSDDVLIARELELVEASAVPADVVAQMGDLGLFGMTLPRKWGGLGWSMEEQVLLTMEFTRASCVYRSRFSTTIGLSSQIILDHGTPEQKSLYLPEMAEGRCVAAFALTEPEAGSDASSVSTIARRDGQGWRLDGRKRFITNGAWADLLVIFARDEQTASMCAFLVDRRSEGVTVQAAKTMNGHEAGPVAEIELHDVKIGEEALLGGEPGHGLRQALRGINHARTHVAATAVGQALRLQMEAGVHAATRRQFGKPLVDIDTVAASLGTSYSEIEAGRTMVLECARRFDNGPIPWQFIAATKLFCTEMVGRVADRAVQILGGEGIVGDSPIPRMWRDVRALRIYEGASEVHQVNLGRHAARESAAAKTATKRPLKGCI